MTPPPDSVSDTRSFGRRIADRVIQRIYRAGYRVAWRWWRLRRTKPKGVGMVIWSEGRVLMVRHSYRPGLTIPGGNIRRNDDPRLTASRELAEEVGLHIPPEEFREFGRDRFSILYDAILDEPQPLAIDHREIHRGGIRGARRSGFTQPDHPRADAGRCPAQRDVARRKFSWSIFSP